ncbi:hypothetical protein J1N35_019407 [Gossypium stocksii]|uniref:Uncharacterized protein n=1 Tax=Gossypium stocksii TaxID=47602 RepID=A0A9D3VSV7_9ROSI|nr:hypothetical protein J1N35_019407 [Gossypium stocksii]
MAGDARLQKEVNVLQQEMVKIQGKPAHLDTELEPKLEAWWQAFKEELKGEIRTDIHSLFERYLGNPTASSNVSAQAKGKEILGGPPLGFPAKESIDVPQPLLVTSHTSSPRSHSGVSRMLRVMTSKSVQTSWRIPLLRANLPRNPFRLCMLLKVSY